MAFPSCLTQGGRHCTTEPFARQRSVVHAAPLYDLELRKDAPGNCKVLNPYTLEVMAQGT